MTEQLSAAGKLAQDYGNKPIIRSLLQLLPYWSVADTLLQQRLDEIRHDRLKTFFDELAKGKCELTEELIQQEDFLHCYFSTLRAAQNTRHRQKIRLLAQLLDSSLSPSIKTTTDEYEGLLAVLDAITLREFTVLCGLRGHECRHPQTEQENELQNASHYWDQFKSESIRHYGIPVDAFTAFMAKLERTGLYLRITVLFLGNPMNIGRTTSLFARLLEFVKDNGT